MKILLYVWPHFRLTIVQPDDIALSYAVSDRSVLLARRVRDVRIAYLKGQGGQSKPIL